MAKPQVEYYEDAAGEWRWTLKGANGEIVASGEGHGTQADAERAFERTVALASEAWANSIATDEASLQQHGVNMDELQREVGNE